MVARGLLVTTALVTGLAVCSTQGAKAVIALNPGSCTTNCGTTTTPLTAPDPMLVNFDENGVATIAVNGGPPTTLAGGLAADPTVPAGGGVPVLTYFLPQPVVSGVVFFTEPTSTAVVLSDALVFTDNTGVINGGVTGAGTRMIFLSEIEPGELNTLLADVGIPTFANAFSITRAEIGTEGNNGFDYLPGAAYPLNNEYVGISDAVPEPSTWAMMLIGFAGLGFAGLRQAKRNRTAATA